jgi:cardiolipin synthase
MPLTESESLTALGTLAALMVHGAGVAHALHALMHVRTSQGTIAWVVTLVLFPYVAVPFYWVAGRARFSGYVRARRAGDVRLRKLAESMHTRLRHFEVDIPDDGFSMAARYLGGLPFTRGNALDLLIDGKETFDRLFQHMEAAEHYICANFYIVKHDRVGTRFQELLISRARAGVKVWLLLDELGSYKLPRKYLRALAEAGVECEAFGVNRHWWSRLQINFRNHRKLMVIDGKIAFLGGLNVADEYLGRNQHFGKWRDTHLQMKGPAVQAAQLVFLEDWFWACGRVPELKWTTHPEVADQVAAVIPTGPSDPGDSWQLMVAEAANTSRERLWIASPYFVPDEGVLTALQTAAIRGVDVRILIPERADHLLVWLSAFTYYEDVLPFNVKILRYHRGFLHQKVMLIDSRMAAVGTANLDNRSFRLNFEITAFSNDPGFVAEVAEMLASDLTHSSEARVEDFTERPFWFRAACRVARLMAPLQ